MNNDTDAMAQALRKIAQLDGDGLPEHTPQAMVHIANAALANSCDLGVGCDEAGACYAMTDCETCCGSGEIVTDWERYKHPRDGDVGDEAVADCPDCDGNGKVEVPSLAAQDGLVEAARLRRLADDCSGYEPSLSALQRAAHDAAAIIEQMFGALKTARVYLTDFEGLPETDCNNPLKKIDAALASIEVKS